MLHFSYAFALNRLKVTCSIIITYDQDESAQIELKRVKSCSNRQVQEEYWTESLRMEHDDSKQLLQKFLGGNCFRFSCGTNLSAKLDESTRVRLVSTPSLVPQRCRVVNRENYVSDLLVLRSSELLALLVTYVCMSSNLLLSCSIPPRPRLLMQENETHEFGPGTWLTRQRCFWVDFFPPTER